MERENEVRLLVEELEWVSHATFWRSFCGSPLTPLIVDPSIHLSATQSLDTQKKGSLFLPNSSVVYRTIRAYDIPKI